MSATSRARRSAERCEQRRVPVQQPPHGRADDRVRPSPPRRWCGPAAGCRRGGLQDGVDLDLHGGGVLVHVDAEGAAAGAGGDRARTVAVPDPQRAEPPRRAAQQQRAGPQVGPAAYGQPLHRRAGAGGAQLGREAVEQHREPPQAGLGEQRLDRLARRRRPGRGRRRAIRRWPARPARTGPRRAGSQAAAAPPPSPGGPATARAYARAPSSRRASSASWTAPSSAVRAPARADEMLLPRRPGRDLLRRLGRRHAQRRGPDGAGQAGQRRPPAPRRGRSSPWASAPSNPCTRASASSSPARARSSSSARISAPPATAGTSASPGSAPWCGQLQVGQVAQEAAEHRRPPASRLAAEAARHTGDRGSVRAPRRPRRAGSGRRGRRRTAARPRRRARAGACRASRRSAAARPVVVGAAR